MINKGIVIPLLVVIIIIIISITLIIGIYYFNWFNKSENNYTKIDDEIITELIYHDDLTTDNSFTIVKDKSKNSSSRDDFLEKASKFKLHIEKDQSKTNFKDNNLKNMPVKSISKQIKSVSSGLKKTHHIDIYSKGSNISDQEFDSYGEYISEDEYQYRVSLIKNLFVKTIIVDKLTQGNGISQEYFKVVYLNKMIPAKILDDIVESKQFRKLIPKKYIVVETTIKHLPKGEKIIFNNHDIKELLILWSLGRLTPIQKAWEVKADK